MKKTLFEDALILKVVQSGRFLVRRLPFRASLAFARAVGRLVFIFSRRGGIAYRNLKMALGDELSPRKLKIIARRSFENLAMNAVDLLRVPDMDLKYIEEHFTIEGREKFEPHIRQKRGVIFLTGHFGSWELLNIAASLLGMPLVALARLQKHPRSDAYLNHLRESKGSQIIYKGIMIRQILKSLHEGKIVAILSDQDGGKKGRFVHLFDRLSSTPPGVAAFSLRTDAPIFPVFIFRQKGEKHRIEVGDALKMPDTNATPDEAETFILQQFADTLESKIRRSPDQWLWGHRRWKSSPDKRVLVLSDGRAGHVHQSMAVVEAMQRRRAKEGYGDRIFCEELVIQFKNSFMRTLLRTFSIVCRGHIPLRTQWLKAALTRESYKRMRRVYADVVISCGSSLQDVNIWIKHENKAKSVLIMKPSVSQELFDAIILPKHDKMVSSERVFVTEGALSAIRQEDLSRESQKLSSELVLERYSMKIGLLVGGDTTKIQFQPALFEKWMQSLQQFCLQQRAGVIATSSRRTPTWAEQVMKNHFLDKAVCPYLIIANEANREGGVSAILGLCDWVIVTGESMSMISEAVMSGKPVLVANPWSQEVSVKPKYEQYLDRLEKDGKIVRVLLEQFSAQMKAASEKMGEPDMDFRHRQDAVLQNALQRIL